MKRIAFILVLGLLSTTALFAQSKKDDRFESNFFRNEELNGMVQDIHDGFKNLHDKIQSKIKEKEEERKARQQTRNQQNANKQHVNKQTANRQTTEKKEEPQAAPAEDVLTAQPSISFNGHEFFATNISSKNGVIRNAFVSDDSPQQVLILREYPESKDPGPEKWEMGPGYPADSSEIIFNKNFITSTINQGQDVTVIDTRWPMDQHFQDLSFTRTVRLNNNMVRQYVYRFRIENPRINDAAIQRSSKLLQQALHNMEQFNPTLVRGNYSF